MGAAMTDTIHATATAPGKAGVAVIRVSGPAAAAVCDGLGGGTPPPRRATLRRLEAADGTLIDHALVLRFDGTASFTGEPVVEFHTHGGPAIVQATLDAIAATGLSRLARPGEFTHRALRNGKLDLIQVHGLADAIEAETELQRRAALRRLDGAAGERIRGWRSALVHVASRLEASVDFSDEELPADLLTDLTDRLRSIHDEFSAELDGFAAAQALRTGFEVAVIGPPNVGKSSLINALSNRDVAIVSPVAGTTRDVIEVRLDVRGVPVTLLDTAGLRDGADPIERLGVERARTRATAADLRIILVEGDDALITEPRSGDLVVRTKVDLHGGEGVSARTGAGLARLLDRVHNVLVRRVQVPSSIARTYERDAIAEARTHLAAATDEFRDRPVELVLADLYAAVECLRMVIGEVGVEHLLDEIFASFCLGK